MTKKILKIINFRDSTINDSDSSISIKSLTDKNIVTLTRSLNWFLSKRRSGTANVKDFNQISGTTKKPFKQKGTGNARQGSKRSVQFVGGRTCHGPKTRSFCYSIPKKIIRGSINIAIRSKIANNNLFICQNLNLDKVKTSIVSNFFLINKIESALIVSEVSDKNFTKSIKNIKNIKFATYNSINSYDIIRYKNLIIDKELYINQIEKII
jgi:large subunit ribosomal protein L4